MAKQLNEFVQSVQNMSTDQLLALTKKIRKNKYTDKPATAARKTRTGKSAIEKLKGTMSKEELIKILQEG